MALKKAEIAKQDRMRSEEARRLEEEEKSFKEEEALLAKQEEERRVRAHTLTHKYTHIAWALDKAPNILTSHHLCQTTQHH